MNKTSDILYEVSRINWKEVERTWSEVCCCACNGQFPLHLISSLEQRKAALRRVEIELDEADDIVRSLSCM